MVLGTKGRIRITARTIAFYGLCWIALALSGFAAFFCLAGVPAGFTALNSGLDFSAASVLEKIEDSPAEFERILGGLHATRINFFGLMDASLSGFSRFLLLASVLLAIARMVMPSKLRPRLRLFRVAIFLSAFGGAVGLALRLKVSSARKLLPAVQDVLETGTALGPAGLQEALILSARSLRSAAIISLVFIVGATILSVWLFTVLSKLAQPMRAVREVGENSEDLA